MVRGVPGGMISALNRKLLRDLWRLRGQVFAVALVVASGVGVLIMSLGTLGALERMADAYYERYRFAHVFAAVKRAPERLAGKIAEIPGVQAVETRIVDYAVLDMPGVAEPVIGKLVSIPERGEQNLNRIVLRSGRLVAPGHPEEVVVGEPFAIAHGLSAGDTFHAVINGNKRQVRVVGVALSPEFVYAIAPGGLMPDDRRFGILWMGREALTAAFDMEGAFNDVSISLLHGTRQDRVIAALDRILDPYGAVAAYGREDHESNWFLMNEIKQLGTTAKIMPTIFLTVAAFLCHMVMTRMIATERDEIGLLKAFGYSNGAIGWHYAKMVLAMTTVGILLGWGIGYGMGRYMTSMYAEFFRFPFVFYHLSPGAFALASGLSLTISLIAALGAVRAAVALSPAEAMRPPAPPLFRRAGGFAAAMGRVLDQPTRIVLRQIVRWPLRTSMSTTGIALAVGLLITSIQWVDAINRLVDVYFGQAQRQDATVGLADIRPLSAVREMARLPGVRAAEAARFVSVRLRANGISRREAIIGVSPNAVLNPIYDTVGGVVPVPEDGLVLSLSLAKILGVATGDRIDVEVLEGRRAVLSLPVAGLFDTYIATPLYMNVAALNRAMREAPVVNIVHLLTDPAREAELFAALKNIPQVSAVTLKRQAIDVFHETMGETMLIFVGFFVVFACFLVVGVVYNSARISLSERGRELATMRVLGFSRADVSYILLGEVGLITFVAMPLGCLIGRGLVWLIADSFDTEMFRVPPVIEPETYGLSVLFAVGAAVVSAAIVRRAVDQLDMIAVLKTWE